MFNKSVNVMKKPSRENFCFSNQILLNLVATLAVWKLLKRAKFHLDISKIIPSRTIK